MMKRILVTRTDRIGDVVLSTPVFSAIRRRYPNVHLAALVAESNRDLIDGNPNLDEFILYDKRFVHRSWKETYRFSCALKEKKFDVVINLHANNRVHWISYLSGIPRRIGYRRKNAFLLNETIPDEKWKGERHESSYNFDLLRFIDVPEPPVMELYVPLLESHQVRLEERLAAEGLGRNEPYVILHPSASCPSRLWRAERYAEVGLRLMKTRGARIILVAGRSYENEIQCERLNTLMRKQAVNLAGKLTLGMLACLIKGAELIISNDSGPVHIAAALGVRNITIFGRNQAGLSPRRWHPLGQPSTYIQKDVGCLECAAHRCNLGFLCLDEVKVEDVLDAVSA